MEHNISVFKDCLREQLRLHRAMQPRDVVKLCYQGVFGAEHLLSDMTGARAYLEEEFSQVPVTHEPLYEQISPLICRVNLGAWKGEGRSAEDLFQLFARSASVTENGAAVMEEYLSAAGQVLAEMPVGFSLGDWDAFVGQYLAEGMPAVRHTEAYRAAEHPAYRIVHMDKLK